MFGHIYLKETFTFLKSTRSNVGKHPSSHNKNTSSFNSQILLDKQNHLLVMLEHGNLNTKRSFLQEMSKFNT